LSWWSWLKKRRKEEEEKERRILFKKGKRGRKNDGAGGEGQDAW
jgi:hypothetical protein